MGDNVTIWFSNDGGTNWFKVTDDAANAVGKNTLPWITPLQDASYISETARMGVSVRGAAAPTVAASDIFV